MTSPLKPTPEQHNLHRIATALEGIERSLKSLVSPQSQTGGRARQINHGALTLLARIADALDEQNKQAAQRSD